MSSNFSWNARHHAGLTFHVLLSVRFWYFPILSLFPVTLAQTLSHGIAQVSVESKDRQLFFNPKWLMFLKIIFSTTDIRTLESKRRAKCKLICQRTFCSMGMQPSLCPCKFQDNFHIFWSSAGGFYQLMSAIWYTEKKTDWWGQWWYKRIFCQMGLAFHKVLSKSRLFIDPRTQNVLNGLWHQWWHQTHTFHHQASLLKWKLQIPLRTNFQNS